MITSHRFRIRASWLPSLVSTAPSPSPAPLHLGPLPLSLCCCRVLSGVVPSLSLHHLVGSHPFPLPPPSRRQSSFRISLASSASPAALSSFRSSSSSPPPPANPRAAHLLRGSAIVSYLPPLRRDFPLLPPRFSPFLISSKGDVAVGRRIERMTMKVGENLFNFMQSFYSVDGSKMVVPMDILDQWFRKF
ncbi:hypothetical protein ACLOJK_005824 [Asimina triloba]